MRAAYVGYKNEFVKIIYSDLMSVAPELDLDLEHPCRHAAIGRRFLDDHEVTFTFGYVARTLTNTFSLRRTLELHDLFSFLDVEART